MIARFVTPVFAANSSAKKPGKTSAVFAVYGPFQHPQPSNDPLPSAIEADDYDAPFVPAKEVLWLSGIDGAPPLRRRS